MKLPKLTKLEMQIMEVLWSRGHATIRDIQEAFPKRNRPAYTTIQTTVYRLETKKTLRRARKISHAHIFEPLISRSQAQGRLIDELLSLLGDRLQPVMAHLIDSRRLTLDHIREAEQALLARGDEEKKDEEDQTS
jgi:BlaI family penicillinase repressor